MSIVAIVGGALALAKPKLAGILMIIAAIGGFIAVSLAYIVAGPLILIGGLLALFAKTPEPVQTTPIPTTTTVATPAGETVMSDVSDGPAVAR